MKKLILIVAIIIVVAVAGIISKVTYDKIYTAKVNKAIEESGLNPEDYNLEKGASPEEIREAITQQEINKTLLEMGVSPEEVDLSNFDFVGLTNEEIYSIVSKEVSKQVTETSSAKAQTTTYSSDTYICTANQSIASRGYIVIHGAGGPDAGKTTIKNAVSVDPNFGGYLYFTYDANQETLNTIGTRFVSEYNTFATQEFDEIIIYGQSAGGVVASYAAHLLGNATYIEVHTLASPLNGYKFGSAAEQIAQQFTGLNKEIGLCINPYAKPPANVKIFHHKTVEAQTLRSSCGAFASLCSPKVIQDNNVPGSSEFAYPKETHDSIINTVVKETLSCRK